MVGLLRIDGIGQMCKEIGPLDTFGIKNMIDLCAFYGLADRLSCSTWIEMRIRYSIGWLGECECTDLFQTFTLVTRMPRNVVSASPHACLSPVGCYHVFVNPSSFFLFASGNVSYDYCIL